MKPSTLKINGSRVIPIETIRFIRPLTDEDRARASDKLKVDTAKFRIRIEFNDKTSNLATDTLDHIQGQGVGLVDIGAGRFVPAVNIKAAEDWTEEDAAKLREKGEYTLKEEFRSRVETTAGLTFLSTSSAEEVMFLRAKALTHGVASNGAAAIQPEPTTSVAEEEEEPAPRRRSGKGREVKQPAANKPPEPGQP